MPRRSAQVVPVPTVGAGTSGQFTITSGEECRKQRGQEAPWKGAKLKGRKALEVTPESSEVFQGESPRDPAPSAPASNDPGHRNG